MFLHLCFFISLVFASSVRNIFPLSKPLIAYIIEFQDLQYQLADMFILEQVRIHSLPKFTRDSTVPSVFI